MTHSLEDEGRRMALIVKKHGDGLTPEEEAELERLQASFGEFQDKFQPLPGEENTL